MLMNRIRGLAKRREVARRCLYPSNLYHEREIRLTGCSRRGRRADARRLR